MALVIERRGCETLPTSRFRKENERKLDENETALTADGITSAEHLITLKKVERREEMVCKVSLAGL
jgi:hypothetical protein